MEVARGRRAEGLARGVSEHSRRRAAGAALDQDREHLNAAFASIVKLMRGVSQECERLNSDKIRPILLELFGLFDQGGRSSVVTTDGSRTALTRLICSGEDANKFAVEPEEGCCGLQYTSQNCCTNVQKYYGAMATHKCKEHEIKHFCKYHGRRVEIKQDFTEERTEGSVAPRQHPRRLSKDFYIEVSPGIYSVTAMSEDMVQQTHVVDVSAGQSVDLTFVL